MLKLKPSNQTPPDLFRFKFNDGHTVTAFGRQDWIDAAKKYAEDNGYEVPSPEEMEDQLCRTLSGEWCTGGDEYSFVSPRFTNDDYERGMKTLVSSGQLVSKPEADQRAIICSRCVLNMPIPGCASCTGRSSFVTEMRRKNKTEVDHLLKVCGISHRANQATVWLPTDDLLNGITPEMTEKYKRTNECWLKNELLNHPA